MRVESRGIRFSHPLSISLSLPLLAFPRISPILREAGAGSWRLLRDLLGKFMFGWSAVAILLPSPFISFLAPPRHADLQLLRSLTWTNFRMRVSARELYRRDSILRRVLYHIDAIGKIVDFTLRADDLSPPRKSWWWLEVVLQLTNM